MDFQCNCLISEKMTVPTRLNEKSPEAFKVQLRKLLDETKKPEGIVYVWRTEKGIPRLRGESPIIYIGKAKYSLYMRYISQIERETTNYWKRYQHIMSNFGPISIDIYETTNIKMTENTFLFQYQEKYFERPPLNIQSYKTSLLTVSQQDQLEL